MSSAMDSKDEEKVMIALYYWYIPIPKRFIEKHRDFHKEICQSLNLNGRIRISKEGLNGVLSGTKVNLMSYEKQLIDEVNRNEFAKYRKEDDEDCRYGNSLDVKYCRLRSDIDVEKQMFTSLSVKITSEVVSLNENAVLEEQKAKSRRRRKGRGRSKVVPELNEQNQLEKNKHHSTLSAKTSETKKAENKEIDLDKYQPATHLTPQEWNEKLLNDANSGEDSNAILIDARNVYESNIGHFAVDGIPTLLTNTRKYSTIPSVLKASIPDMAGKNVYMYCTGGVRCERASVYLQALSNSPDWPEDVEKPSNIFQLQGGIQKYLESYGEQEIHNNGEENSSNGNQEADEVRPCLFAGKNFVFDQRRYDPVVGNGFHGNNKTIGRCVVCSCLHDDYDNGHAPCENKEARCFRCRVLVLVCKDCRPTVRIWGEVDGSSDKPELFCGGVENQCINEGNEVQHCELRQY